MIKSILASALLAASAVQASPAFTERGLENAINNDPFTLPKADRNPRARAAAIEVKRKGWQYSTYPMGVAYYPTGTLANKTIAKDQETWLPPILELQAAIDVETTAALDAIKSKGGLTKLEDYSKLYDGQWPKAFPDGPFPGMLTNFTDDRTFSMMRLSASPYRLKRVQAQDNLLFPVDNAASITGLSLQKLQAQGRLFLEDFSEMKELDPTDKFGAGCQAYFYIDPKSGDFLPLAIRPLVKGREDSALVYTPKDETNDWTLAKMFMNQNDGWHATWAHITQSHSAAEAPYLAAIRTLSDSHPVMVMLQRIEKTPWNIRPLLQAGVESGASPSAGPQYYAWTSISGRTWANQVYSSGETSKFQGNYYRTFLENQGLINSRFGPSLKSFPFYEDAGVVTEAIRDFMTAFVNSYYPNDNAVAQDSELQAWQRETDVAKVYDFPKSIKAKQTLVDILTHQAYLGAIVHGVMSTNGAIGDTTSLPFAPAGFRQPIPTKKGVKDVMAFMPTPEGAVWQVATYAAANRAAWRDTNETISYMFADDAMLNRMNDQTRAAAGKFKASMDAFSKVVRARKFDKNGLERGMPFLWNVLDPNWAAYWSVV
ncbi:putative manganese lipoxygenase protein [Rosellinia necatrix]|uniref:Manganese lipoxygenase n=1 Tax=Rosellinia necatrix TaxID=77044 RepID=A0A1W2TJY1_ROSNE|nr:putative manganese lipoxygenase protein [Rosellinia necatrix]